MVSMLEEKKKTGKMVSIDEILERVKKISECINVSSSKLSQSVKFIDYFVHDILDFSILRKDDEKFVKDITIFDIESSVQEILEI